MVERDEQRFARKAAGLDAGRRVRRKAERDSVVLETMTPSMPSRKHLGGDVGELGLVEIRRDLQEDRHLGRGRFVARRHDPRQQFAQASRAPAARAGPGYWARRC